MNRKIDDLGRLVIPKEWRTELKLNAGDDVNMELEGDKIIITNPNLRDEFEEWLVSCIDNYGKNEKTYLTTVLEKYRYCKK